jgi:2-polyprenyl-3-methyl-5-hydroxy-6-metoxy-1,4-benzoquinol methylase
MAGKMTNTIDYYNLNADDYYESTIGVDFGRMRSRFASYLPEHARILDAGCGSGRDVKAFCEMGFQAVGLDASEELARIASRRLGIRIHVADMTTWISREPYDGIWCCASLLHLQDEDAEQFLRNLRYNLAPGGILYVSVKEGVRTGPDEKGRYFRNYTREELTDRLRAAGLTILEEEASGDLLGRDRFRWLNVFARRD